MSTLICSKNALEGKKGEREDLPISQPRQEGLKGKSTDELLGGIELWQFHTSQHKSDGLWIEPWPGSQ